MSTEEHAVTAPTAQADLGSADPILLGDDDARPQGSSLISLYWDNASPDHERERFGSPPLWSPPQVNRLLRLLLPPADEPTAEKPEATRE